MSYMRHIFNLSIAVLFLLGKLFFTPVRVRGKKSALFGLGFSHKFRVFILTKVFLQTCWNKKNAALN